MEMLFGIGAVWFAAAATVTFGLAHAAAAQPFQLDGDARRPLFLVGPR